ncbi:MAG: response regulator [Pseudomonadales bacterium]
MDLLKILLLVYIAILSLNTIFSVQLWFLYRLRLYLLLVGVWFFTLINLSLQAITLQSSLGSVMAFSSYIASAFCLCTILAEVSSLSFSFNKYWIAFFLGLAASLLISTQSSSFTLIALPVAAAIAMPQILLACNKLMGYRDHGTELSNTFALVLLLNGIHFLDYPFLRQNLDFAVFGYAIVIGFSMMFAALLPCILSKYHSDELSTLLAEKVKETQAKSKFLANMNHEIRTPLNAIVGLNDLLINTPLNSKQQEYCEHIEISSNGLLGIVNNILDLSQLESGVVPIHRESFSPFKLAEDIVGYYIAGKDKLNHSLLLRHEIVEPIPTVLISDQGKIRQIAYNLINNAIKYSEGSEIVFSLRYDEANIGANTPQSGQLIVVVYDDGVGISPDQIDTIFDRFTRHTHTTQQGVGLGLAIVKELVTLLGGTISLANRKDCSGLIITCKFPTAIECGDNAITPDITTAFNRTDDSGDKSLCVLVVEDNPNNQLVITEMLEVFNINYILANNGTEALAAYTTYNPNLILLDNHLPDTSGLIITQRIRQQNPLIPIIMISAHAFNEDVEKGLQAGANAYLRKPIRMKELYAVLKEYEPKKDEVT